MHLKSSPSMNSRLLGLFFFTTLLSTILAFNVKSLILIFIISFGILYFLFSLNLFDTAFVTTLLVIPFEKALRQWTLYSPNINYIGHYEFIYGVDLKTVFGFLLILLLIHYHFSHPRNSYPKPNIYLTLFLVLATASTFLIQGRTIYLFTGYIKIILAYTFYLSTLIFSSPKKISSIIKPYFIALIMFSTFFGLAQFVRQKQLGKYIELTPSFSPSGYTTTDGPIQYRVSAFIAHPVYFGSFISILLPILIGILTPYIISGSKIVRIISYSMILLTTIVTISTLSRTTWINLAITFIAFYYYLKQYLIIDLSLITNTFSSYKQYLISGILLLTVPLVYLVSLRASSLTTLLSSQGNLTVRSQLALDSLNLTLTHPIAGVGLNNFPYEAKELHHKGNVLPPPHNTLLIFLSELGIPTTIFFILFLFTTIMPKTNIFKWDSFKFGIWLGLISFIISSQFHPLFNLDPTFDLFLVCSALFTYLCQPSKT